MAGAPLPTSSDDNDLVRSAGVTLPPTTRVTPMLRQWLEAKAKAKDAVLLFRMGDFYELFGDDALLAGQVLDLAVTTRDRDKGDSAMPMAGFPHPQAPVYIARLIAAGLKVAVCDQLEDPALARGIVKRDVTRIVTPGMVLEDESLDARSNNFLLGITVAGSVDDGFGLCALDVSTGQMLGTTVPSQAALVEEVSRLAPREIVVESDMLDHVVEQLAATPARVERRARPKARRLVDALGAPDALFLEAARKHALLACELALLYVEETGQGTLPRHLLPPRPYVVGDQLLLDPVTRSHLELTGPPGDLRREGTLLAVVDRTKTAAGGRRLLRLLVAPAADLGVIEGRLDRLQALVERGALRARLLEALTGFPDVERLVARAAARRSVPRDLVRLRAALRALPGIVALLQEAGGALEHDLDTLAELRGALDRALVEEPALALGQGPVFSRGHDAALDELTDLASGGRDRIAALEEQEKKATGIATLKVRYTSVFGYYIEVTKAHLTKVPAHYKRKQTVANAERYVTEELAALEDQVEGAEARRGAREQSLFDELVTLVAEESRRLLATAERMADLDAAVALAEVAAAERWCRPRLLPREARRLALDEARHPVVERALLAKGEPFVPSSVELSGAERQILVVTGPNMAGKSTMMRQVALIQVLAQAGSFVPAKRAELSICDRIFTRVGASDDLSGGRSTFMVEMTETSAILRAATPHSLVLLDEIGRGTSTYDGLSIAWAVAEHIHDVTGSRTLFATHYHELTQLAAHLPRLKNVHAVVKEWNDEIVFVRTLAEGAAERSYGIQVARLAGLPPPVVQRAREVLATLEGEAPPTEGERLPRTRRQEPASPAPQMSLFVPPAPPSALVGSEPPVLQKLRSLDVLRMTPLEAMNALAALIDEAKR
jgi:DNA mismatch repair protein MutS